MVKVKKHIFYTEIRDIEILGATLLSEDEARHLLKKEDRKYYINSWLRSPGRYTGSVTYIGVSGNIYQIGSSASNSYAIKPALLIKCNSSFEVGDIFEFDGRKFKIISPELAWMIEGDIGHVQFNKDWRSLNANIYEASNVKRFIEDWFNTAIRRN